MHGLERSSRVLGGVRGHWAGVAGEALLDYRTARYAIYLPTYRWVLEHNLAALVEELRGLAAARAVVLLDYETNGDPENLARLLSHAWLVARWVEGRYPAAEAADSALGTAHVGRDRAASVG